MNAHVLSLLGRQLNPVFLPGKSHGQRSLAGLQSMGLQGVGQDLVDNDEQQLAYDEPVCRAGREMQTYRMDFWTQNGKERVGQIESIVLTYIHYRV